MGSTRLATTLTSLPRPILAVTLDRFYQGSQVAVGPLQRILGVSPPTSNCARRRSCRRPQAARTLRTCQSTVRPPALRLLDRPRGRHRHRHGRVNSTVLPAISLRARYIRRPHVLQAARVGRPLTRIHAFPGLRDNRRRHRISRTARRNARGADRRLIASYRSDRRVDPGDESGDGAQIGFECESASPKPARIPRTDRRLTCSHQSAPNCP